MGSLAKLGVLAERLGVVVVVLTIPSAMMVTFKGISTEAVVVVPREGVAKFSSAPAKWSSNWLLSVDSPKEVAFMCRGLHTTTIQVSGLSPRKHFTESTGIPSEEFSLKSTSLSICGIHISLP